VVRARLGSPPEGKQLSIGYRGRLSYLEHWTTRPCWKLLHLGDVQRLTDSWPTRFADAVQVASHGMKVLTVGLFACNSMLQRTDSAWRRQISERRIKLKSRDFPKAEDSFIHGLCKVDRVFMEGSPPSAGQSVAWAKRVTLTIMPSCKRESPVSPVWKALADKPAREAMNPRDGRANRGYYENGRGADWGPLHVLQMQSNEMRAFLLVMYNSSRAPKMGIDNTSSPIPSPLMPSNMLNIQVSYAMRLS
jgi:hypothetical protein